MSSLTSSDSRPSLRIRSLDIPLCLLQSVGGSHMLMLQGTGCLCWVWRGFWEEVTNTLIFAGEKGNSEMPNVNMMVDWNSQTQGPASELWEGQIGLFWLRTHCNLRDISCKTFSIFSLWKNTLQCSILHSSRVLFGGTKYIHIVVQGSPPSISRTLFTCKTKAVSKIH